MEPFNRKRSQFSLLPVVRYIQEPKVLYIPFLPIYLFYFLSLPMPCGKCPNQGLNPYLLQWKCGVLTTGQPGNSLYFHINNQPLFLAAIFSCIKGKLFYIFKNLKVYTQWEISLLPSWVTVSSQCFVLLFHNQDYVTRHSVCDDYESWRVS